MLSPFVLSRRIPKWILVKSFNSLSCTNRIRNNTEIDQSHQSLPSTSEIEVRIQSLGYKLCPGYFIHVLDSTDDINAALKIFKWASQQKGFYHNSDTYYWMILKLGMAGNVKEMEGLVHNMVKDRCPGGQNTLFSLVDVFVRHHRLDEAISVLVNMSVAGYKPTIDVFNFVLGAIVEEKRGFNDVVFLYKEMVKAGVAPTVNTLNYVLEVLFETDRVDSALEQYKRMNKKGCSPNSRTFEIVLKGLIARNKVNDSVVILHEMLEQGCNPELSFYVCAVPFFCKEDRLEEGMRLFRMMKASNFVLDSSIYEALIDCSCKNLRLDDAINLVEEMAKSCLTPANNVFENVVNMFCKLGKINEAIKFLEDRNVIVTSPHNALIGCCCDAAQFFVAKGLLEKMSERNIDDSKSWNILIRWLCERLEIRKAHEVLGRMITSSLLPNSGTYAALVVGSCRSRKYDDALQLFLQLRARCWILDFDSYSELIEGLCSAEKYLEAVEVFLYMFENRCSLQPYLFDKLIKGMCDIGRVNEAIRLKLLAYNSGIYCADASYNCIMLGLSAIKNGKNLLAFLSQRLVQGCYLDMEAYCILIQSMIAQNKIKACAVFFKSMVNGGLVPDPSTLYNLLSCLANNCQLHLISNTVDKLASDFDVLDLSMYNILVNGLWMEGNKSEARQLLDLMLEKGWVPDAMTHGLLIGTAEMETAGDRRVTSEFSVKDGISDILAEGLPKM